MSMLTNIGAQNRDRIVALQRAIQDDLFRRYGANIIDVDYKRVGGQKTEDLALCLWFDEKIPNLAGHMRVPSKINGIWTDIRRGAVCSTQNYVLSPNLFANMTTQHRPLRVGSAIAYDLEGQGVPGGEGSLGCFVRDNTSPRVMILSNYHVLMKVESLGIGSVTQPPEKFCGAKHPVATYVRGSLGGNMDAAVAALDPAVAWLNRTPDDTIISGTATCKVDTMVKKYGPATDWTSGIVTSFSAAFRRSGPLPVEMRDLMRVAPVLPVSLRGPGALGDREYIFQYSGDSGSTLLDANNAIVGLLHSGVIDPRSDDFGCGFATPIHEVFGKLRVRLA